MNLVWDLWNKEIDWDWLVPIVNKKDIKQVNTLSFEAKGPNRVGMIV